MSKRDLRWITIWVLTLMVIVFFIPGILVTSIYSHLGPESVNSERNVIKHELDQQSDQKNDGENDLINGLKIDEAKDQTQPSTLEEEPQIPVYLTKEKRVETVSLTHYIRGVLAAEMPAQFELEALKAQAIAVRTYILRRWNLQDNSLVPVKGALVTDSITHQVYLTEAGMKRKWPTAKEYETYKAKLTRAVNDTKGQVITYRDELIVAAFFSTSNGYTENSEEYWENSAPYLRSVESPWDKQISPKYKETVKFTAAEFAKRLGIGQSSKGTKPSMEILERTTGKRVKKIQIGSKRFTGREVREKLELNSAQFTWKWNKDSIEITTYGYGHGVGMSQWGANGLAKEGKSAEQILKYYYTDIEIKKS